MSVASAAFSVKKPIEECDGLSRPESSLNTLQLLEDQSGNLAPKDRWADVFRTSPSAKQIYKEVVLCPASRSGRDHISALSFCLRERVIRRRYVSVTIVDQQRKCF